MLQQEGLIDAQPDRRAVIAHLEPEEQDALWAERILLESLAARMGAGRLSTYELDDLQSSLDRMTDAASTEDFSTWSAAHRAFHEVSGAYAGASVNELVRTLAEKTTRYLLLHNKRVPHSFAEALNDHRAIFEALMKGDADATEKATSLHVGRPALILLAQVVPSFEPVAVRAALVMAGATDYLRPGGRASG